MPPRTKLFLFAVFMLALDGLAFAYARQLGVSIESALVCYALLFSQVGLAAIWGGLGAGHLALRMVALAAAAPAVAWSFNRLHDNNGVWILLLSVQIVAILFPLLLVRWIRGVQWRSGAKFAGSADAQPLQFTLWQVVVVMTGIAVTLAIGRVAVRYIPVSALVISWFDLLAIAGGFAVSALLAAWLAFGHGPAWLRSAVFILGTGAVAAGQFWTLGAPDQIVALLTAAQGILLALWLWVIGRIGYGLVRIGAKQGATAT